MTDMMNDLRERQYAMMTDAEKVSHLEAELANVDRAIEGKDLDGLITGRVAEIEDLRERAMHNSRSIPDLIAHIERLQQGLREAREALCDYACHGGPDVPCTRTPDQCRSECGKSAGDAIVTIDKALSQGTSHE